MRDVTQIETLKDVLLGLQLMRRKPLDEGAGICTNLIKEGRSQNLDYVSMDLLSEYVYGSMPGHYRAWPHFSGVFGFPVPLDATARPTRTPVDIYMTTTRHWEGSYGELRKSLLNHLIQCVQDELNAAVGESE